MDSSRTQDSPFDWKLFLIVITTIFLSFLLVLLDKGVEYPLALLAVGSNIMTAYVSYRFGRGIAPKARTRSEKNNHARLHVFIVFLFSILYIISLFLLTETYFLSKIASLIMILFIFYIMFIYTSYSRRVG